MTVGQGFTIFEDAPVVDETVASMTNRCRSPWLHMYVQLARHRRMLGRILREEAHPIGCCVVTHRSMVYLGEAAASARSTRL